MRMKKWMAFFDGYYENSDHFDECDLFSPL